MKVLLVNPPNVGKFGLQNVFQAEPLGLECIASALEGHHDVRVLDMRWEADLEARLELFDPDVVGISCLYTSHIGSTWELARRIKSFRRTLPVVVGGQPPTLAPEWFGSADIDTVVRGDGERVMPALLQAMEKETPLHEVADLVLNELGGQRSTPPSKKPKSLGPETRPSRRVAGIDRSKHYLAFTRPIALVEMNRGCPFDCDFCSIWKMSDGRLRSRQVDEAVAELASVPESDIFLVDDHAFANPQLMRAIGEAILDAGLDKSFKVQSRADVFVKHPELIELWAKAGLKQVFLGLEGHSDLRLDEVRKRTDSGTNTSAVKLLEAAGVGVVGNFMVDPTFTKADFDALAEHVESNGMHHAGYCIATPFPGTDLWTRRKGEVNTLDFELFDIQHAVMDTRLPLEEFYEEYALLWRKRAALHPEETFLSKAKRVGSLVLGGKLNLELLKNVRRFDKDVARAEAYLEDHRDVVTPWVDASQGRLGPAVPAA